MRIARLQSGAASRWSGANGGLAFLAYLTSRRERVHGKMESVRKSIDGFAASNGVQGQALRAANASPAVPVWRRRE